jgi:hypothetical protein
MYCLTYRTGGIKGRVNDPYEVKKWATPSIGRGGAGREGDEKNARLLLCPVAIICFNHEKLITKTRSRFFIWKVH